MSRKAKNNLSKEYVDGALKALGEGGVKLKDAAHNPLFGESANAAKYQRLFYRVRALALDGRVRIEHDGREIVYYTLSEEKEKENEATPIASKRNYLTHEDSLHP